MGRTGRPQGHVARRAVNRITPGIPHRPQPTNRWALPDLSAAHADALQAFWRQHPALLQAGRVLVLRPSAPALLAALDPARTRCVQTERGAHDLLAAAGYTVCTEPVGDCDLALVEATKHKAETLYHLALAWSHLRPEGSLLLCAANRLGAASLVRQLAVLGPATEVYSKARCRIVWLQRPRQGASAPPADWLRQGLLQPVSDSPLLACAGAFSASRIDPGTRLLCETLDRPLQGCGADLGAGWGAVSCHLLQHHPQIRELHLYESEWKALQAARINLAPWADRVGLHYHWHDVRHGLQEGALDWVVMNPPFHQGQATRPELGTCFITAAAAALARGGSLWLVANRRLPYEAILEAHFTRIRTCREAAGYKVIEASGRHDSAGP